LPRTAWSLHPIRCPHCLYGDPPSNKVTTYLPPTAAMVCLPSQHPGRSTPSACRAGGLLSPLTSLSPQAIRSQHRWSPHLAAVWGAPCCRLGCTMPTASQARTIHAPLAYGLQRTIRSLHIVCAYRPAGCHRVCAPPECSPSQVSDGSKISAYCITRLFAVPPLTLQPSFLRSLSGDAHPLSSCHPLAVTPVCTRLQLSGRQVLSHRGVTCQHAVALRTIISLWR
jgi:hypothetical protein